MVMTKDCSFRLTIKGLRKIHDAAGVGQAYCIT
ncbi:hypothetical protein SAMN05428977_101027 [Nitrosomonas sp. Nm166]|nr:hypothetical protein SAMN05428977_101027 [Nitrosomonas sp. Nm166]